MYIRLQSNPDAAEIFRTRPDQPTQPLIKRGLGLSPGGKETGVWR